MTQPTNAQVARAVDAASKAIRQAIENYSSWYSGMISDDLLREMVGKGVTATLPVFFPPAPPPQPTSNQKGSDE